MRKFILLGCSLLLGISLHAQSKSNQDAMLKKNAEYAGAQAHKELYKVIYQLDSNNPDIIKKAIRNINNVLNDPRLKGKLEVELITFSGGTEALLKTSPFEEAIKDLIFKGVRVAQCNNSLQERNLTKDQLFPFIGYVPSGNGELVIRSAEGWTIVKP
ncbi:DsrE family protein [Sphingobacterium humi]|uniref:Uncharacterized protein n=1 Tax=Sphingobacterium humi TaxID=1796905 RepID=A0A6N8L113_9SPHI|nr:DsrE family protein [Sphingobacterium humi]MVZ63046.1 hypothetical protein [Sphingobacterium humi]